MGGPSKTPKRVPRAPPSTPSPLQTAPTADSRPQADGGISTSLDNARQVERVLDHSTVCLELKSGLRYLNISFWTADGGPDHGQLIDVTPIPGDTARCGILVERILRAGDEAGNPMHQERSHMKRYEVSWESVEYASN